MIFRDPQPVLSTDLPASSCKDEIVYIVRKHQFIVIVKNQGGKPEETDPYNFLRLSLPALSFIMSRPYLEKYFPRCESSRVFLQLFYEDRQRADLDRFFFSVSDQVQKRGKNDRSKKNAGLFRQLFLDS